MKPQKIYPENIIYLVRHGAIDPMPVRCFIGQTDLPLSPVGRKQSERLGMQCQDIVFSQVWCSDLQRASETAAIVMQNRSTAIHSSPALREINLGEWDGLAMSQVRDQFPEHWLARGENIDHFRPPGAESFYDLQQRVVPFIRHIAAESSGNSLIVTHAGVIRVLLCWVLQMPLSHLFRIQLDYGGITLIKDFNGMTRVMAVNISPALPTTDDLI